MMSDLGALDGQFVFYAVVTPDGKIPTVNEDAHLNDSSRWYTGPIGTIAHLSDFALVATDPDDADVDLERHRDKLPAGTRVRGFTVTVEEIDLEHLDELLASPGTEP